MSYRPWGHNESDTSEQLTHTHTFPFAYWASFDLGGFIFQGHLLAFCTIHGVLR